MFRAVGKRGITIIVSAKKKASYAKFRMRSPEEVLKFLKEILKVI